LSENKIIQLLGFLNAFQVSSDRILSANTATLARIELAHTQAIITAELEKNKNLKRGKNEGTEPMIIELLVEPEILSANEDEIREEYRKRLKNLNDTIKNSEKIEIGEFDYPHSVLEKGVKRQLKKENLDLLRDDICDDNDSLLSFPYSSSYSASTSLRDKKAGKIKSIKNANESTIKNENENEKITNIHNSYSLSLDYADCTGTTLNIEAEKEVENLSDCSDDSFLSAVEDYFPVEKSFSGEKVLSGVNSFSGSKSDDAIDMVEELNNLIKQTESYRSQLMSDIRLIEGNKNKEVFLIVLQDDLRLCEKELHQLKIRYVESLLIADREEVKEGNVIIEKTKESEEAAAGVLMLYYFLYRVLFFIPYTIFYTVYYLFYRILFFIPHSRNCVAFSQICFIYLKFLIFLELFFI
jgi:hypothetical protein